MAVFFSSLLYPMYSGGSALGKLESSLSKAQYLLFCSTVPSEQILKYAYTLDVLIHQFICVEYSGDTSQFS